MSHLDRNLITGSDLPCMICAKASAPYRFKCCRQPFCSVECHALHDQQTCQVERTSSVPTRKNEQGNILDEDEGSSDLTHSNDDSPDELTPEEISLLRTNVRLHGHYLSSKIRDCVAHIMESPNPQQVLETAFEDPEFRDFCDALVNTTGRLETEQQG
eukprot:Blabericola_migrator_1__4508@NODE_2403_length_2817_cov_85_449818_g1506_i0_p4_GENE_NODE_2403_length_2817_cov_85_449818_g1506_i0NODE_2403_length_2817_cov_85_449818_g1506_i0_p4_ORF_typecomplete_len158_score14_80zfHIT/PF04438_16/0_04GerD/PF17898_1/0_17_NODE_2403_length_2817_cov_85_449818_g1506_i022532726